MSLVKDLYTDFDRIHLHVNHANRKPWQQMLSFTKVFLKDPRLNHWTLGPQVLPFVWHTAMTNDALDGCRLPYPHMILEYNFHAELLGLTGPIPEGNVEAPKRVVVLNETPEKGKNGFQMVVYAKANLPSNNYYMPTTPAWIPSFYGLFICYEALNEIESHFEQINDSEWIIHYSKGGITPFPWLELGAIADRAVSSDQRRKMLEELGDDLKIVIGLLAILNCSNASTTTIPAPKFLNRKRKKKGKFLIPEYRTLHVSAPAATSGRVSLSGPAGLRATHWRRGHIRNQPTAKGPIRKWIKPCIVGTGSATPKEVVVT